MRMRSPLSGSAVIVKCEEKTGALTQFVTQWVISAHENNADLMGSRLVASTPAILLIARSPASPVALAVAEAGMKIAAAGLRVKAAFTTIADVRALQPWINSASAIPFGREVRFARSPRIADAHEQLILGTTAVWFGDCMRRDPAQRDAFESYFPSCPEMASDAARTFARLWQRTEPIAVRAPIGSLNLQVASPPAPAHQGEQMTPSAPGETTPAPLASTRH